jgi:predicted DsbA family dithiol-disulfide isomerase
VAVLVRYFTDPACPMSWGHQPVVRRIEAEYGAEIRWQWVMGGLGRDYAGHEKALLAAWTEEASLIDMPMDPLLWKEGPIQSSYPSCLAVKAGGDQGLAAQTRYLRTLREGLLCFRRKLDTTEALVEEARRAGLDVERFRIDLASHGTVEAFGADLDLTRDVPEGSPREDRVPFPSAQVGDTWLFGRFSFEDFVKAIGKEPSGERLSLEEAFTRYERLAPAEIEALCGLPGPKAQAELWQQVSDWKLKPLKSLTGWLFERA